MKLSIIENKEGKGVSAWGNYQYEISYIDPEEMSQLRVYTDREHLLEMLDKIFAKHGYRVKIKKMY